MPGEATRFEQVSGDLEPLLPERMERGIPRLLVLSTGSTGPRPASLDISSKSSNTKLRGIVGQVPLAQQVANDGLAPFSVC